MPKRDFKGYIPGQPLRTPKPTFKCGKPRPQPVEPNPRVMEARKLLGLTERSTTGPIAYAYQNGWLSRQEVIMADVYASAYRRSGLLSPDVSVARDHGVATGAAAHLRREWEDLSDEEVRKLKFGVDFTDYETAKIWDSAMRPLRGEGASAGAMRRWKAFAACMTPSERDQVDRVVVRSYWPTWILARRQGRDEPRGERERALLISGLRKIGAKVELMRHQSPANDHHSNDNSA